MKMMEIVAYHAPIGFSSVATDLQWPIFSVCMLSSLQIMEGFEFAWKDSHPDEKHVIVHHSLTSNPKFGKIIQLQTNGRVSTTWNIALVHIFIVQLFIHLKIKFEGKAITMTKEREFKSCRVVTLKTGLSKFSNQIQPSTKQQIFTRKRQTL